MDSSQEILKQVRSFQILNDAPQLNITTKTALTTQNIPCREVHLKAPSTNTGTIYIGGPNMTKTNATITLEPSEEMSIRIDNVKNIYADSSVSGDKLNYSWVV